jgi:hypothetical protein
MAGACAPSQSAVATAIVRNILAIRVSPAAESILHGHASAVKLDLTGR